MLFIKKWKYTDKGPKILFAWVVKFLRPFQAQLIEPDSLKILQPTIVFLCATCYLSMVYDRKYGDKDMRLYAHMKANM